MAYNRYKKPSENGTKEIRPLPYISIKERSTDKFIIFQEDTRFDKLANDYYGDPTLGFFIELANPEKPMRFDFNIGDQIRIPFPLQQVKEEYNEKIKKYYEL